MQQINLVQEIGIAKEINEAILEQQIFTLT